ncbi:Uncharacterised protein [Mycobacteroides abscessus subsp. abscessus]|nr:Uncharacterised protein [Mycobacteroides abscessus]SHT02967.1 Uncharacterised protein [Mycobacteroides abscessus subsp. abscessus]SID58606.1 Uncharacterised protein [Mycobacteroides abscessus subsp. abscessus]SIG75898.1 Uncharacterised protein [Mycobacteroides abscessus subsp. abscessus]SIN53122.1 Uncharacterised protein [Mycobacteroides abscessus subsp. abscessus]
MEQSSAPHYLRLLRAPGLITRTHAVRSIGHNLYDNHAHSSSTKANYRIHLRLDAPGHHRLVLGFGTDGEFAYRVRISSVRAAIEGR